MSEDTTLPGIAGTNSADLTDATDSSLITDFTQVVSCVVGKDRRERQRQKIRDELVRDYISNSQSVTSSPLKPFYKIFRRN